jgi:hypothetical protein
MKPTMYYRFEIGSIIRQYPLLFFPLLRLSHKVGGLRPPALIARDTELVLEGYFRTGNTFSALAFFLAQPTPTPVANHTHAIATLLVAAQRSLPTLVLLRRPADTVVSAVLKTPGTKLSQHLKWYIRYYETVHRYQEHFYVALFDELTTDLGEVIRNVNRRFGTTFVPFDHTQENAAKVFHWIEEIDRGIHAGSTAQYSIPLQERRAAKRLVMKELERAEYSHLLERANQVYQSICVKRLRSAV